MRFPLAVLACGIAAACSSAFAQTQNYPTKTVKFWWGILFPTGVPRPIIDKVANDFQKVLTRQDVKDKMGEFGIETVWKSSDQFGKFMETERARWGKLIREANIRID
jgi:tripartite-type tricarboxylate transporter receptor subunit TctC